MYHHHYTSFNVVRMSEILKTKNLKGYSILVISKHGQGIWWLNTEINENTDDDTQITK